MTTGYFLITIILTNLHATAAANATLQLIDLIKRIQIDSPEGECLWTNTFIVGHAIDITYFSERLPSTVVLTDQNTTIGVSMPRDCSTIIVDSNQAFPIKNYSRLIESSYTIP